MIIYLDDQKFYIDDDKLIAALSKNAQQNMGKQIKLPNGPTIDLSSKSLLSVALRQMLVFLLPVVSWASELLKISIPKKERHEDIVKYIITSYFTIMKHVCNETTLVVTSDKTQTEVREISSVTIDKKNSQLPNIPLPFLSMLNSGN